MTNNKIMGRTKKQPHIHHTSNITRFERGDSDLRAAAEAVVECWNDTMAVTSVSIPVDKHGDTYIVTITKL